jgi:uncharacterized protein (TIGR02217 family)
MTSFHDVRFPLDIAMRARGGPERRTDVVTMGSGREERNARWAHSRRRYDAGYGVTSLASISVVLTFFEERRGMLYGFRWRDRADFKSCAPNMSATPMDQLIGIADGTCGPFQLKKTYGTSFAPYVRPIQKIVENSARIAVDGVERADAIDFDLDCNSGLLTFREGKAPTAGSSITGGFLFDVPVRFDTDYLEIDLAAFEAGDIPKIPLIEIKL